MTTANTLASRTQSRIELIRRAAQRSYPERIPVNINTWKGVWKAFPELMTVLKERGMDDFHYDYTDYYGYRAPDLMDGTPLRYHTPFGAEIVSLDGEDLGQAMEHIFADGFSAIADGSWTPPVLPAASGADVDALRMKLDTMQQSGYPRQTGVYCIMHELCALRGFEDTMMDLYDQDPMWVQLVDTITEYSVATARQGVAAGTEFVIIGDDWGTQSALYCRPEMWREFFGPRYARIIREAKAGGAVFYFHSDGHIVNVIPDMLDMGADIINPQLSCHDWEELRDAFSGRGCISADLDRQHTLITGSPRTNQRAYPPGHRILRVARRRFDPACRVKPQPDLGTSTGCSQWVAGVRHVL